VIQRCFSRFRQISLLRSVLLSMGLLDEMITGFPVVGLPLLRDQFGLSYAQVGLLFGVSALSGMILDPIIILVSDRGSKRWWVLAGLLGLVLCFALMGSTHSFALLLLAFGLYSPCSSAAVGLSEAILIDQAPQNSMQTMTRWVLMGSIGDLLSPLIVALVVTLQLGWPVLCWVGVALWLGAALVIVTHRLPNPIPGADNRDTVPEVNIWMGLREALQDPVLLRWTALARIPTMLDEVFLGFASLYLRDILHASEATIGLILAFALVGALSGLFALERLFKRMAIPPQRLLLGLVVLSLVGVIGLLTIRSIEFAACSLFVISLGTAGWFPIAQAEAYARLPGRSGTVRAIGSLSAPFEVALPGIVGFIAGNFGLLAGVGFLGLAPVLMLILLPWRKKKDK
jgi:MFS family permease